MHLTWSMYLNTVLSAQDTKVSKSYLPSWNLQFRKMAFIQITIKISISLQNKTRTMKEKRSIPCKHNRRSWPRLGDWRRAGCWRNLKDGMVRKGLRTQKASKITAGFGSALWMNSMTHTKALSGSSHSWILWMERKQSSGYFFILSPGKYFIHAWRH